MKYLLAVLLPPCAVWSCGKKDEFFLNIILCLCGYIPGVIHALFVVRKDTMETFIEAFKQQRNAEQELFASIKASQGQK